MDLSNLSEDTPVATADGEKPIADIEVGDDIRRADGSYGEVEAIKFVHQPQVMYNLTVDEAHTFFVGDGQWLVHNVCDADIGQIGQQAHAAGQNGTLDNFIRTNGQVYSGGGRNRFPNTNAPNTILYSTDDGTPTGIIQRYIVYNDNGQAAYRVDVTGRTHNNVPTPHTIVWEEHTDPSTGDVFYQPAAVPRAAYSYEVP